MRSKAPKAKLLYRERIEFPDGTFAELVLWDVPEPVPPTTHGFKYRLAYVVGGKRVVGYDNERGKGDHRHYEGTETPYQFENANKVLADFRTDVKRYRGDMS